MCSIPFEDKKRIFKYLEDKCKLKFSFGYLFGGKSRFDFNIVDSFALWIASDKIYGGAAFATYIDDSGDEIFILLHSLDKILRDTGTISILHLFNENHQFNIDVIKTINPKIGDAFIEDTIDSMHEISKNYDVKCDDLAILEAGTSIEELAIDANLWFENNDHQQKTNVALL